LDKEYQIEAIFLTL